MYRARLLACCLVSLAASCGGDATTLLVDVRTDLVPGREFTRVRTEVRRGDETARELGSVSTPANTNADWGMGVRVAELGGLEDGPIALRVALLDASGAEVLSRRARFTLEGTRGVTVVFARACTEVMCPTPGDDPGATECLGNRCVPPECTVEDDEPCGAAECAADADCPAAAACARPRCIGGACLAIPDDALCEGETWCHPTRGCVADLGDASVPDAGLDGGADGSIDCAGGCDDGNPCTDDACVGGSCAHTNNTAPCDDGVFCNGADTCAAGTCTHAGDPCSGSTVCDEAGGSCVGCVSGADCPADSFGAWTACGSFADTCDQTGTRSRGVTSWECVSMVCTASTSTEMGSCTRATDGVGCGTTTYGSWSACGSFSGTCDETGSRSRNVTTYACSGGTCTPSTSPETGSCTRDTDGTSCGTTMYGAWGACGGFSDTCDETGMRSRSVTTYACASATCSPTMGSESEPCTRDTDGTDCTRAFEFPCHVTRCSSGLCSVVGDTCGTGICCEFGCQPSGTSCP